MPDVDIVIWPAIESAPSLTWHIIACSNVFSPCPFTLTVSRFSNFIVNEYPENGSRIVCFIGVYQFHFAMQVAEMVFERSKGQLLKWMLGRLRPRQFDSIKQYTSEVICTPCLHHFNTGNEAFLEQITIVIGYRSRCWTAWTVLASLAFCTQNFSHGPDVMARV